MSFVCHMNATTKEDVESMEYLLHDVWLFVRLWDHGVVFCVAITLIAEFQKCHF